MLVKMWIDDKKRKSGFRERTRVLSKYSENNRKENNAYISGLAILYVELIRDGQVE